MKRAHPPKERFNHESGGIRLWRTIPRTAAAQGLGNHSGRDHSPRGAAMLVVGAGRPRWTSSWPATLSVGISTPTGWRSATATAGTLVRHRHGPIPIRQPPVDDRRLAREGESRFSSAILPRYARRAPSVDNLIPTLYLKGVSSVTSRRRWRRSWETTRLG